nr:TPA_asm: M91 uORF RNA *1 [Murid betaherpesvirus 1]DBA07848.1 TPA_asm: M91 uORF RNA *1 [Murid betaherpesvirus 1]
MRSPTSSGSTGAVWRTGTRSGPCRCRRGRRSARAGRCKPPGVLCPRFPRRAGPRDRPRDGK